MIAPPQVQAHNLANAIRTDIGSTLLLCYRANAFTGKSREQADGYSLSATTQNKALTAMALTLISSLKSSGNAFFLRSEMVNVPLWNVDHREHEEWRVDGSDAKTCLASAEKSVL